MTLERVNYDNFHFWSHSLKNKSIHCTFQSHLDIGKRCINYYSNSNGKAISHQ